MLLVVISLGLVAGSTLMFLLSIPRMQLAIRLLVWVVMLLAAGFIYILAGSPQLADETNLVDENTALVQLLGELDATKLTTIVNDLERQIISDINQGEQDIVLWRQLIALKLVSKNFPAAEANARQALAIFPGDIGLLLLQIRARIEINQGTIDPETKGLIDNMLLYEPDNIQARWLNGLGLLQRGNIAQAEQLLRAIAAEMHDAEDRQTLENEINKLLGNNVNN